MQIQGWAPWGKNNGMQLPRGKWLGKEQHVCLMPFIANLSCVKLWKSHDLVHKLILIVQFFSLFVFSFMWGSDIKPQWLRFCKPSLLKVKAFNYPSKAGGKKCSPQLHVQTPTCHCPYLERDLSCLRCLSHSRSLLLSLSRDLELGSHGVV